MSLIDMPHGFRAGLPALWEKARRAGGRWCPVPEERKKYFLYLCVCVALLPALTLRDFTPSNELRYLSIADEALRDHHFFAFTNQGVPYAEKPPLYLWIVMLCRRVAGTHLMWLLSLFSLVPALVTADIMDRWAAEEAGARQRLTAQTMLLTCGLFLGLAATLRMDMLMCMFIVLSLRSFHKMMREPGKARAERWLFPAYVFLAVFSKGPVGILVPLVASAAWLALKRRMREFGRYWGVRTWCVLAACCAAWFGAVYAEGGGDGYLNDLLFHQTIGRAVNSFRHEEPFYYYLTSIWYSVAPWSLLAVGAAVAAFRKGMATDLQRFFLTVAGATFVLLSCVSSKLQVYLLPAFPFLIYPAALLLPKFEGSGWAKAAIAVPAAIFAVSLPALPAFVSSGMMRGMEHPLFYVAAGMLSAGGICALVCLYGKGGSPAKAITPMAAGLLAAVFCGGWALPDINPAIGYKAVCDKALEVARRKGADGFSTWNIKRSEGMDVYLGKDVNVVDKDSVPASVEGHPTILMTRKRDLPAFPGKESWTVGDFAVVAL